MCLIYSENPQGKEDKEGQKEWSDHIEEGNEVELTGELIWQLDSDAVILYTKLLEKLLKLAEYKYLKIYSQ